MLFVEKEHVFYDVFVLMFAFLCCLYWYYVFLFPSLLIFCLLVLFDVLYLFVVLLLFEDTNDLHGFYSCFFPWLSFMFMRILVDFIVFTISLLFLSCSCFIFYIVIVFFSARLCRRKSRSIKAEKKQKQ